jgi:hypothetical protein
LWRLRLSRFKDRGTAFYENRYSNHERDSNDQYRYGVSRFPSETAPPD